MKKTGYLFLTMMVFFGILTFTQAQDSILALKEKIIDIQNQGVLGFRNFTLCTHIIGYGQYVPAPGNTVKTDAKLQFYYEPVNLFTNRIGGSYHIWYTQDIVLLTSAGEEIYSAEGLINFNYQTTSPVLDVFATNSLDVTGLPPGTYHYRAIIHDRLKNVDASHTFQFQIIQ